MPTTVEAIVVQPGALQSILACPLQHQGEGVKINGSNIAFYLVDNRHLHFSTADSQARRIGESCVTTLCSCFAETSDAIFMPAGEESSLSFPIEVRLARDHKLFLWNSVLVVPGFFSREECHIFMDAADRAASAGTAAGNYSNQPGLNRYPIKKLDLEAQMLSDSLFQDRLLPFLEHTPFACELFGAESLKELKAFFSPGEPAVNRYITGGGIAPHMDREQLTLNVLLSEADAFQGGGTAFWPQTRSDAKASMEKVDEEEEDMVVLRPLQGTAILFNGQVTHAGCAR